MVPYKTANFASSDNEVGHIKLMLVVKRKKLSFNTDKQSGYNLATLNLGSVSVLDCNISQNDFGSCDLVVLQQKNKNKLKKEVGALGKKCLRL